MKEIITLAAALGLAWGASRLSNAKDILARTIWGEARADDDKDGRPDEMEAVAMVIMNRARLKKLPVVAVCLAEKQFSAWNIADPNRIKLLTVTDKDAQFKQALEIAGRAIDGTLKDITGGSTHYHTLNIRPYWADSTKLTKIIGNHAFYANIA